MDKKNKLDEINLARINDDELNKIQKLEKELNEKYFIIAFERK